MGPKMKSLNQNNHSELKITLGLYGHGHRTDFLVVKRDQKFPKGGILGFWGEEQWL